jgi:hypothetical protein
MSSDRVHIIEREDVGSSVQATESVGQRWRCHTKAELFRPGSTVPFYTKEVEGNLLLLGGASVIWECLKGSGSTSTASAKHYFNTAAALGVGNSTAAAAATQTALQGASKKFKALSATFPTHTTGSTGTTHGKIIYKSTFTTADANFTWGEWTIANRVTTGAVQRLLNRKAGVLLTKTSAATASLTVTLSLA